MNLQTIVGHIGGSCKGEYEEQLPWESSPVSAADIRSKLKRHVTELFGFLETKSDDRTFDEVERALRTMLFTLARLFLAYFLARRHESSEPEARRWIAKGYRRRKPQRKHLNTFFGRVTFWRTYVRRPGGSGLHPLDVALGLSADGFSRLVLGLSARLSTLVSYEQVTALQLLFLSWSPSKTTVEKTVLGFGRDTEAWFEAAPPPEGDGEVLLIQVDSKATATATEEELKKRRGTRQKKKPAPSPRHRARQKRARCPKKRREKGDKSKNGKAVTIVTMYTLRKSRDENGKRILLGPINKQVYASYAPKRHAFAIARREADKRGFAKGCGKTIQIVTDGDEDLERGVKEFFPGAIHTLDIMHALEYVWEAGRLVYEKGSAELATWVKKQEKLLYKGRPVLVLQHLCDLQSNVSGDRAIQRLETIREYLRKRISLMNYDELRKQDLEVASGMVEGAVRHVIAKRFDNGSMRWIRERAEALLQLRCIEVNGHWDAFMAFVDQRAAAKALEDDRPARLLTTKPKALPTYGLAS